MNIQEQYRLALERVEPGDVTPMMLFPLGNFRSAKYPQLPLTRELADEVIANFHSGVLGTEPFVETSGSHDTSAPAGAWVKRVYTAPTKDGGEALFADVRWTAAGAAVVNDQQYRYNSVELGSVVDNRSGARTDNVLRSVTLTNTPVIRLLPPVLEAGDAIAASEAQPVELLLSEISESEETDNESEDSGQNAAAPAGSGSVDAAEGDKDAEGQPTRLAAGDAAERGETPMKSVIKALRLAEDSGEDAVLAAVFALSEERDAERKRADDAEAKLAERDADVRKRTVEAKLDEATKPDEQGCLRILPGEREAYMKFAEVDHEAALAAIEARLAGPVALKLGEDGSGDEGDSGESYADPSVELAEKAKARAKADKTSFSEAMRLVLAEDEDLDARYAAWRAGKEA